MRNEVRTWLRLSGALTVLTILSTAARPQGTEVDLKIDAADITLPDPIDECTSVQLKADIHNVGIAYAVLGEVNDEVTYSFYLGSTVTGVRVRARLRSSNGEQITVGVLVDASGPNVLQTSSTSWTSPLTLFPATVLGQGTHTLRLRLTSGGDADTDLHLDSIALERISDGVAVFADQAEHYSGGGGSVNAIRPQNVTVSVFDGDPDSGGVQVGSNLITGDAMQTTSAGTVSYLNGGGVAGIGTSWNGTQLGAHDFHFRIAADPNETALGNNASFDTSDVVRPATYCDNLEGYALGSHLTEACGWEQWEGAANTHNVITSNRAHSGTQSVATFQTADVIHQHDPSRLSSGQYEIAVWQYISDQPPDRLEAGDTTWFIFLSDYQHGQGSGNTWIVQLRMDGDGTWTIDAGTSGGATNTGFFFPNQWVRLSAVVDLDADLIEVFYDGISCAPPYSISGGIFGNANGPIQLDTLDLYSPTSSPTSIGYYDDYSLLEPGQQCQTKVTYYCTAKAGLVCGTPCISASGTSSATASSGFVLSASPARQNRTGFVLYSSGGRAALPFHGGFLCVFPAPLRRMCLVSSGGSSSCDGLFETDVNTFNTGGCGGNPDSFLSQPGTLVNAQYWGRDGAATGSYLTNGVEWIVGP